MTKPNKPPKKPRVKRYAARYVIRPFKGFVRLSVNDSSAEWYIDNRKDGEVILKYLMKTIKELDDARKKAT